MTGLAQLVLEGGSGNEQTTRLIEQVLSTNRKDPHVYLARAVLKRPQGAVDGYAGDLRQALEPDPDILEAEASLAMVEAERGNAQIAIAHLRQVMNALGRRRELLSAVVDAAVVLAHHGHIGAVSNAIQQATALE